MTATGYVGIEPEAAQWLAAAVDRAGADVAAAAHRIDGLLAEAGESAGTAAVLARLEEQLRWDAGDIRRRAVLAAFDGGGVADAGRFGSGGNDPLCVVPWNDPLVRAARAIRVNAANAGAGAWTSLSEGVSGIWQLVPGVDGWRQAWVDSAVGLAAAVRHPGQAVRAAAGVDAYEERGFSYWAGGFVPDLGFYLLGGAGVAKTATRVSSVAGDLGAAARKSSALRRATDRLPGRRRDVEADVPVEQRPVPRARWLEERRAKAEIEAIDAEGNGHNASRHGAGTTAAEQRRRAETGIGPDGSQRKPYNASRFFRWHDQAEAIRRARVIRLDPETKDRSRVTVVMEHPVGEGYLAGTLEYRRTATVVVRFNEDGVPYTSFPELKKGWVPK